MRRARRPVQGRLRTGRNERMRRLDLSIGFGALLCLQAATAMAQSGGVMAQGGITGGYGMSGCGLGSILFGTDQNKVMQILAATSNGCFGSQTFGITSGTSNCVSGGVVKAEKEQ